MARQQMTLHRCERLNAMISEAACKANRYRGKGMMKHAAPIYACVDCPGLNMNEGQQLDAEEVHQINKETTDMGRMCQEPGCDKYSVVKGYCTSHAKEHGLAADVKAKSDKKRTANAPETRKECAKAVDPPQKAEKPLKEEMLLINLLDMYDAAQKEKRERFISSINELNNPVQRLQYVLDSLRAEA